MVVYEIRTFFASAGILCECTDYSVSKLTTASRGEQERTYVKGLMHGGLVLLGFLPYSLIEGQNFKVQLNCFMHILVICAYVILTHPANLFCILFGGIIEGDLDKALKQKRAKGDAIPELVSCKKCNESIAGFVRLTMLSMATKNGSLSNNLHLHVHVLLSRSYNNY